MMTINVAIFSGRPDPNAIGLETGTERTYNGVLTTDHAASSYGLPVLVRDDGQVLGPNDLDDLHLLTRPARSEDVEGNEYAEYPDGAAELVAAARRAGYRFSTSERL